MYEKFNAFDVDAAGSGGEYTVQAGFGWTNGAVLWVAGNFGKILDAPKCPAIDISPDLGLQKRSGVGSSVGYSGKRLIHHDGQYVVKKTQEVNQWR